MFLKVGFSRFSSLYFFKRISALFELFRAFYILKRW